MKKWIRAYLYSAGVTLLAMASALFLSIWTKPVLDYFPLRDPVLNLPLPEFYGVLGVLILFLAVYSLFGSRQPLQLALIFWFSCNIIIYKAGLHFMGVTGGGRGYLYSVSDAFYLNSSSVVLLTSIAAGYLFVGSLVGLGLRKAAEVTTQAGLSIKLICPKCGGHIECSQRNLASKTSCPHCQAEVTLRRPDESLKMSCFFCHGHIMFPAHALGTKMQCPHCKMDITLKETP